MEKRIPRAEAPCIPFTKIDASELSSRLILDIYTSLGKTTCTASVHGRRACPIRPFGLSNQAKAFLARLGKWDLIDAMHCSAAANPEVTENVFTKLHVYPQDGITRERNRPKERKQGKN
eukprot:1145694-Pelagomonas_calceolata.AAC.3